VHQIDLTHLEYALTGAWDLRLFSFLEQQGWFLSQTMPHLLEVMMKIQSV
jgi:hypothetical protein